MRIRRELAFLLFAISMLQVFPPAVLAEPPSLEAQGKPSPSMLDGDGQPLPPGAKYRVGTRNWRHCGEGYSICFSPDGKTLALISRHRDLFLMNALTGEVNFSGRLRLKDGSAINSVNAIAFSPDGQELAAHALTGSVELFAVKDCKHVRSLAIKLESFFNTGGRSLVYSKDGKYLAVTVGAGYTVVDPKTGDAVLTEKTAAQIQGVAFNNDSSRLYVASLKPSMKIWDLAKREIAKTWTASEEQFVRGPAVAPNGTTIAIGSQDVLVVDLNTDKVIHRLKREDPNDLFMELAISPDGKLVVGASQEGPVYVWNLADGSRKWKLTSNSWVVRNLALSPDGKSVATSDAGNHVWVWSLETGKLLSAGGPGHDASVDVVAFSPDGTMLVTGSGGKDTHLWDVATGKQMRRLETSSSSLAFTSDGQLLTSWANAPNLRFWKTSSGELLREIAPGGPIIGHFALSGDGKQLVTLERMNEPPGFRMRRLAYPSLMPLGEVKGDGYHEGCIALSHSGELAAVAARELIEIWNLRDGVLAATMSGHTHHPQGLSFTPDDRFLISGSLDQTVRVWEVASCKQVFLLQGHKRSVAAIAVAPGGRIVASAGGSQSYPVEVDDPHQIRLWDIALGKQIAALSGHNVDVSSLAFSPDGKLLASGMYDTSTLVWQAPAAAQVRGFVQQRLTEVEAAELWKDLASPDANQAQKAVVRLAQDAKTAVALAQKTLRPAIAPPDKAVQTLIQDLDSDSFMKREAAMASLEAYGETISDHLKAAVERSESAEIRSRCKQLLANAGRRLEQSAVVLTQSRAVQLLEWCGTTEAAILLRKLEGGASEAQQTKAAKAALGRRQK